MDASKVKGIIFDYGGTLDTGGQHWSNVIQAAYAASGVAIDTAEFREAYVYAERELARVRHILPQHDFHDMLLIKIKIELQWLVSQGLFAPQNVDAKTTEIAGRCYEAAKDNIEKSKPVLELLAARYPLVLVSNFYGNIETVLADFGLTKYFKDVIESAVLGIRKPDPRIFEHGVKALGLQPSETLVIGDSYRKDIEPAEKLGCQVLWLKGESWSKEEEDTFHPDTIEELYQAVEILSEKPKP